ncbi:MAG: DUF4199 domain-containing protein [Phaeodactylibacter sp.]|nr:DUF4199 domain-containing protein [Phaeodactylibacter sp.]MCB9301611.1 DUF4199 domain-containing protein [Lewinellaceae bacterium]
MSTLDNPNERVDQASVSPWPTGLRYGLILGLVLVTVSLVMSLTGLVDPANQDNPTNWIASILSYGIMIGAIVVAIRQHRDGELGSFITFGRSFFMGFIVVLIASVISMIYTYVYFTMIEPGMIENILDASREKMIEGQGMDEDQAEQALSMMSWMFSPVAMTIIAGVGSLFMGAIFSLIVGAIMKRNPPEAV